MRKDPYGLGTQAVGDERRRKRREHILIALKNTGRPMLASEILEYSGLKDSLTRVKMVLAKLEEDGLVACVIALTDGVPRRYYKLAEPDAGPKT